jgi:hypothetical protein
MTRLTTTFFKEIVARVSRGLLQSDKLMFALQLAQIRLRGRADGPTDDEMALLLRGGAAGGGGDVLIITFVVLLSAALHWGWAYFLLLNQQLKKIFSSFLAQ